MKKFKEYCKNLNLPNLEKDFRSVKIKPNDSYQATYPFFVEHFKGIKLLTEQDVVIGIHLVYGWMPTIFDFRSSELQSAVKILNRVKSGESVSVEDLMVLKACFNNSIIGTSKLLHFINPKVYGIWDSKVYRYITKKKPYSAAVNNCQSYFNYNIRCLEITNDVAYLKLHNSVEAKIGYKISKLRSVELIMFLSKK